MTKEFKLIGGFGTILLLICYLSIVGPATADVISEVEILGGDDVITPHMHDKDEWFAFYNEDTISYHIYMYNYTNGHYNYTNSFIGMVNPDQAMMLNKNASYYLYAEYPDTMKLESLEEVKQGVNQYWVIVVVLIIGVVAVYTAIRIIRGRRY